MSARNSRRGRRRARKQEWDDGQERSDTSEILTNLNDVSMERRDLADSNNVDMEHVKKQEIHGHRMKKERLKMEVNDQKTEDINSGRLSSENSISPNNVKKGAPLQMNLELSNGNADNASEMNDDYHEVCSRKRKKYLCECDNFNSKFQGSGLTCIGILPGLKSIIESSDDSDPSCSSDSEGNQNDKYDLLGRKIVYAAKKSSESK